MQSGSDVLKEGGVGECLAFAKYRNAGWERRRLCDPGYSLMIAGLTDDWGTSRNVAKASVKGDGAFWGRCSGATRRRRRRWND